LFSFLRAAFAATLGCDKDDAGTVVDIVVEGGCAKRAGLEEDDFIAEVNGANVL